MNQSIESSILRTLAYADIFDFPLTVGELHQRLISTKAIKKTQLLGSLSKLEKSKKIISKQARVGDKNRYYALAGRNKIFSLRISRNKISEKKAKVGKLVSKWLVKIPGILGVYLTGSVAVSNADQHDDIDLMLITKSGHLWFSRFLSVLALDLIGIRRKPESAENSREASGKICANLYLDLNHLEVPKHKQNLYTANEVIQAKSLFVNPDIHQTFLHKNIWITKYLGNTKITTSKPKVFPHTNSPLHPLAYYLQKTYMHKKITNEFITSGSAYFHPRNTSYIILEKYQKKLAKLGIKP